jgi:hypothetical protein
VEPRRAPLAEELGWRASRTCWSPRRPGVYQCDRITLLKRQHLGGRVRPQAGRDLVNRRSASLDEQVPSAYLGQVSRDPASLPRHEVGLAGTSGPSESTSRKERAVKARTILIEPTTEKERDVRDL